MVKDINELLSVRGTPIIIRRGLPVDLNKVFIFVEITWTVISQGILLMRISHFESCC